MPERRHDRRFGIPAEHLSSSLGIRSKERALLDSVFRQERRIGQLAQRARFLLLVLACLFAALASASAQLPTHPAQAYLAVDHFEIRFEIAIRLDNFAPHIAFEKFLAAPDQITATEQSALLAALTPLLVKAGAVSVDGETLALELDRIQFVTVDEKNGVLPDERSPIPRDDALVAAIFAAPRAALPASASLEWSLFPPPEAFDPARDTVHLHFSSPALSKSVLLTPRADGKPAAQTFAVPPADSVPAALEVPPPPADGAIPLPVLSVLCLVLFLAITVTGFRLRDRMPKFLAPVSLLAAFGAFFLWNHARYTVPNPFFKPEAVTAESADEIVYTLLRNIYHAFDYRSESAIYDTLALSADGDLLTKVYLEIQRSLELENQGGARVRIQNVDLRECVPEPSESFPVPAFAAACEWVAIGAVTHWGHTHTRLNKYSAVFEVAPVDGRWKITALEVINEERLQAPVNK